MGLSVLESQFIRRAGFGVIECYVCLDKSSIATYHLQIGVAEQLLQG